MTANLIILDFGYTRLLKRMQENPNSLFKHVIWENLKIIKAVLGETTVSQISKVLKLDVQKFASWKSLKY